MRVLGCAWLLALVTTGCPPRAVFGDSGVSTPDVVLMCGATLADCDPVTNTGCPSGQACYFAQNASTHAIAGACRTVSSTSDTGASCTNGSVCAPGLVCDTGMCRPACCAGADADSYCRQVTSNPQSTCAVVDQGIGACTLPASCSVASQAECSGGGTCQGRYNEASVNECFPAGSIPSHGACTSPGSPTECVQGNTCVLIGSRAECVPLCNPNLGTGSGCASGVECWAIGGGSAGICVQSCASNPSVCESGTVCCVLTSGSGCFGACQM